MVRYASVRDVMLRACELALRMVSGNGEESIMISRRPKAHEQRTSSANTAEGSKF